MAETKSMLLVIAFYFTTATCQKSYWQLYDQETVAESSFFLRSSYDEADLTSYTSLHKNNRTDAGHAYENLGGSIHYRNPGFSGALGNSAGYCNPACKGWIRSDAIRSFRFTGLKENASAPAFTIFESTYYGGQMFVISKDQPNITTQFRSLVLSTKTPEWTIYTAVNYGGLSLCLKDLYVYNVEGQLGLLPGQIKSVRLGCFSRNIHFTQKRT